MSLPRIRDILWLRAAWLILSTAGDASAFRLTNAGESRGFQASGYNARMSVSIANARITYHNKLKSDGVLVFAKGGKEATNADRRGKASVLIANSVATRLGAANGVKLKGQTLGSKFEIATKAFLDDTLLKLKWHTYLNFQTERCGKEGVKALSRYHQYAHMKQLVKKIGHEKSLSAVAGLGYTVRADIVVFCDPVDEGAIKDLAGLDCSGSEVDSALLKTDTNLAPLLHANVSAKWTMRTDRGQNSRTEALTLIRNRNGRAPHIVVITAEPLPSRIESVAVGTGDIDCVYHFALPELRSALVELMNSEQEPRLRRTLVREKKKLDAMISGHRLKDIAALPLDLAF